MRRVLPTTVFLLALAQSATATHISGGEIYWECLGNNQYEITLIIYRDCFGVQLDNNFDVNFESPCGTFTRNVNTPNGVELSQLCDLQLPNSTCNGGNLPGIEQYSYSVIVTLPPCNAWTISWSLANRNAAIANLQSPNNVQMYVQAVMDNSGGQCEDSPQFTSIASPYVCLNYPVTYSLGAFDPEGDSLTYTLIGAMDSAGVPISYVPPYTYNQPMTGLTLDPQTGLISFTPTLAGNWVVVIEVNSYDSLGNWLGSVMRDMQFVVYPCSNVPPDPTTGVIGNVSGAAVQTGPNAIQVCESGNICFDFVISDANANNILDAVSNVQQSLPGATFSFTGTNPITCTVCWTGSPGTSGFYPFIVTVDDGACPIPAFQIYVYEVTVIDGIFIAAASTDESCVGMNDGSVSVDVIEGTAPFQYNWSSLPQNSDSINVGQGTYSVVVSDGNGCVSAPATVIVNTTQPPVANAGNNLTVCLGGTTTVSGTSQQASSYDWSGGIGTFIGAGGTQQYSPTVSEIASGGVDLYFTANGNGGCPPDVDTVHVSYSNAFLNAGVSDVDATCNGGTNGSATFAPNSTQLGYQWNTNPVQTGATATGLGAGNYTVQVTDALGCDTAMSVVITAPQAISIANVQVVNETCAGQGNGSVSLTVNGGTPPYQYLWSNGMITPSITVGAGNYSVQVTDANGCAPATTTATVQATGQPNAVQAGPDQIACSGSYPVQLSGSVTNATGGTWSGGSGNFFGGGLNPQYTPSATEIAAGGVDLFLTTTGNISCPPATDMVHITLPTTFQTASISANGVACAGGTTGTAVFLPNASNITYLWNDPAGQVTSTATGLASGTYTVLATDQYGCDTTLSVFVPQPMPVTSASMVSIDPTCSNTNNGSATVTASGGTPGYTYQWSANANSQTGATAIGLGTGNYIVVITDANGCTAQANATLTAPQPIVLLAQIPDTVCVNAPTILTAQASGGDGNYTIDWAGIGLGTSLTYSFPATQTVVVTATDGNGCNSPAIMEQVTVLDLSLANLDVYGDTIACPGESATVSATLNNFPGNYTISWPELGTTGNGPFTVPVSANQLLNVIVTDQCGNTMSGSVQLILDVPPTITLPPVIAVGCEPLVVQMPDSLTTQPVSYLWEFGDGNSSMDVAPTHTYSAGTYYVSLTVTTPNGCSANAVNTGLVTAYPSPTAAFTASTWSTDFANQPVQFTNQSPSAPLTYDWEFGDGNNSNDEDPSHNYADIGVFSVTLLVTDANGCTGSVTHPVEITPIYDIVIPNGFTPNTQGGGGGGYDPNDLSNDVFYPFVRFVKDFNMRIYDRWGELVFESNDVRTGWDGYYRGQLSQQDVYAYTMRIRFVDDREVERMGDITLFR
ncbi:MAG: PKD domain-containing protein [Flavobacteriales bacterium]